MPPVANATNETLIALSELFSKAENLHAVLDGVDDAARRVGFDVGTALSKDPSWSSLGWLWGQYRGTILSGHRDFSDFYHHADLGSDDENMLLLGIYWSAYGLQATFGELFDQRCVAQEFKLTPNGEVELNAEPPFWKTLMVTPYVGSTKTANALIYKERSEKSSVRSEVKLQVPYEWVRRLVPGDLPATIQELTRSYKAYRGDASASEANQDPDFEKVHKFLQADDKKKYSALCAALNRKRELLTSEILWSDSPKAHKETRSAIKTFVKPLDTAFIKLAYDEEDAVRRFVTAVQLMALYWSWADSKAQVAQNGTLLVCVPKPHKNGSAQGLQPRLGFAAFLTLPSDKVFSKNIDGVLATWGNFLDKASRKILLKSHVKKNSFVEESEFVAGKEIAAQLIQQTAGLHLGGAIGATILLQRLRRVLLEMERIAPTLVHEGKRFSITVLIGLSYHGQVLGNSLGPVNTFLDQLSDFSPGGQEAVTHLDCMRALVSSCYSLLDWDGVVLFGTFSVDRDEGVTLTSLLRLGEVERHASGISLFRSLTLKHRELAAISIDRDGSIRLFFAGTLLLYKQKGMWRLGSAVEVLRQMLVESLKDTNVLTVSPEDAGALDSFVNLLLRISEEPGHGAMFVICSAGEADAFFSFIAEPPASIWENLRPFALDQTGSGSVEVLYRLAIMDGATLIELDDAKPYPARWHGATIKPRRLVGAKFNLDSFKQIWDRGNWNSWKDVYSFGAKHSSALALAMAARSQTPALPLLVVTVSADGPISFVKGGPNPIVRWP